MMQLEITQDHIDRATKLRREKRVGHDICHDCVVALALQDMFPDKHVTVGYYSLTLWDHLFDPRRPCATMPHHHLSMDNNDDFIDYLETFDKDYPVEPTTFELPDVEEWEHVAV